MTETIQGLDALNRKFKTLENFQRKLRKPMGEAVTIVHDYIATDIPRKAAGAFTALATPGQRRAYWAKVRAGEAEHSESTGYKRQGGLKAWTSKVETTNNGVRGVVGNKKWSGTWQGIYIGEFIQGDHQQPFHKATGIKTTGQTIEATKDKVQKPFEKVIKRELNR